MRAASSSLDDGCYVRWLQPESGRRGLSMRRSKEILGDLHGESHQYARATKAADERWLRKRFRPLHEIWSRLRLPIWPPEGIRALHSLPGRNLAQLCKNVCRGNWSGLSGVETCDASRNLHFPCRVRSRFRIRFDADEKSVREGNALIGRQHHGVVNKCVKCRGHMRKI